MFGHTITQITGSLVPLTAKDEFIGKLQGLSLKNVKIKIIDIVNNKQIYSEFGEMIFTHYGVSGPIVLSASAHLLRYKNIKTLMRTGKNKINYRFKTSINK